MKESADGCYNPLLARFWVGRLDLRPLGLMRITFGLVLIGATLDIGPVLFDFLSDTGVMPRSALLGGIVRANRFCLMDLAGPHWVVATVWGLAVLATICFTFGWHSRLATVLSFFLVCGLHERNLLAFDGADNVIRVMLFWLMFMPVGARYSLDAVLRGAKGRAPTTHAPAFVMRLGQIQIAWVYLDSCIHKWGGNRWHEGTALHYALGLDHLFTRSLGQLLFNASWFTVPGTYFTIGAEAVFLPLVFLPFVQPLSKGIAILVGTALHVGILLTMSVGNFSYLMIATYPLLFEPEWAERTVGLLRRLVGRGVTKVYYDGICPLCRRTVSLLQGFDPFGALSFVDFRERGALADAPGLSQAALESRMHALDGGEIVSGFEAVTRVARRTPALLALGWLGELPGARFIGGPVYDRIARGRRLEHRCDAAACKLPAPPEERSLTAFVPAEIREASTWALRGLLGFLMFSCLWFALPNDAKLQLPGHPIAIPNMPDPLHETLQEIELWQVWDMFSPNPMDTDIWLRGAGQLSDGTNVDVLRGNHGGPLPPVMPGMIFTRWTKFINNLAYTQQPTLIEFGRYLCREWNSAPPVGRAPLKTFKIYREQRRIPGPNEKPVPWGEEMIWDHHCF